MNNTYHSLGVVGTSLKSDEKRIPLHPGHLRLIPAELRQQIFLEEGYASEFGVPDEDLLPHIGGFLPREQLFAQCDIVVLAKPAPGDHGLFKHKQIVCGWPHCVQGQAITQVAIDKQLTLIAWEAMFDWDNDQKIRHTFCKNNELAGFSSVQHALGLRGQTALYGSGELKAVVFGFGATARGAITALNAQGVRDIEVYSRRDPTHILDKMPGVSYASYQPSAGGDEILVADQQRLRDRIVDADIIINCVMQDTNEPVTFLTVEELALLKDDALIIDVSCDEQMGFEFAEPAGFSQPMKILQRDIAYYSVDHSPSFLWRSASAEISKGLLPYLKDLMAGEAAWQRNITLNRAIEILGGQVINPNILRFQHRQPHYPHEIRS